MGGAGVRSLSETGRSLGEVRLGVGAERMRGRWTRGFGAQERGHKGSETENTAYWTLGIV